jgi:hypothetical protein
MTATKTQLIGGLFQDSQGNVLSNGYLKFTLNQDNSVTGVASIAAEIEITINLNSSGSVSTSTDQFLWATDVMTVPNAYYRVTGYTASGQPSWGPNNQQVTSGGTGGGTFDVGTWVPNQVFSWSPPLQSLELEVDGTPNTDQSLLNLTAGSNITITDDGDGEVVIASSGSSFSTPGEGFFFASGMTDLSSLFVNGFNAAITNFSPDQVIVNQFVLQSGWTLSKCAYQLSITSSGKTFTFGIYDSTGNKLIDSGAFNASLNTLQVLSFTPVTLVPGRAYYFAASASDSGSARGPAMQAAASIVAELLPIINGGAVGVGLAANSTTSGVLPTTLGTITPITTAADWQSIPLCVWFV